MSVCQCKPRPQSLECFYFLSLGALSKHQVNAQTQASLLVKKRPRGTELSCVSLEHPTLASPQLSQHRSEPEEIRTCLAESSRCQPETCELSKYCSNSESYLIQCVRRYFFRVDFFKLFSLYPVSAGGILNSLICWVPLTLCLVDLSGTWYICISNSSRAMLIMLGPYLGSHCSEYITYKWCCWVMNYKHD